MSTFFLEDRESPATPDDERVFDLVNDSLGDLRMAHSLDQITARANALYRRRAALTAVAGVVVVTALGAVVTFTPSNTAAHAASTAAGTVSTGRAAGPPRMADPDWTVTADPDGGHTVDITALGDVDGLNATLSSLRIEIEVVEEAPTAGRSACPAAGDAVSLDTVPATVPGTVAATAATTMPATDGASSSPTPSSPSPSATQSLSASPTATRVSFAVSGPPTAFTFGNLPRESIFSFSSLAGGSPTPLGTVRIDDECLPVVDTP